MIKIFHYKILDKKYKTDFVHVDLENLLSVNKKLRWNKISKVKWEKNYRSEISE